MLEDGTSSKNLQKQQSEKDSHTRKNVTQVADEEEEQLFVATCFAISNSSEKWPIDSGCTNHMTFDRVLFKELNTSIVSKVKIGNGEHIAVKGKGTVAIENISRGANNILCNKYPQIPDCKACQQGKQSRLPFKQLTWRAIEKLQLICTDVARPHNSPSLNSSRSNKKVEPENTQLKARRKKEKQTKA
ncbi:hypothetical protein CR513_21500, partial [Mucuna pruriens]